MAEEHPPLPSRSRFALARLTKASRTGVRPRPSQSLSSYPNARGSQTNAPAPAVPLGIPDRTERAA